MTASSPLMMPVQYLKGVGPRRAHALAGVGITTVSDLLEYAPRAYIQRTAEHSLRSIAQQLVTADLFSPSRENVSVLRSEVSIIANVVRVSERQFRSGRTLLEAVIRDSEGTHGVLLFWNAHQYYRRALEPGRLYIITGTPELDRYRRLSFTHPQLQPIEEEEFTMLDQGILPVYRMTESMQSAGISLRLLRQLIRTALEQTKHLLSDPLPEQIRQRYQLPSRSEALEQLHFPVSTDHIESARKRLKFEEIFLFELILAAVRQRYRIGKAPAISPASKHWNELLAQLPFQLTSAQQRALEEIITDMTRGHPMHRLLQGDVGSGKTLVALAAMLHIIDAGYQALLAVPTEVLAEQHYRTIERLVAPLGVSVVKLVGGQSPAQRQDIANRIATGEAQIVVGTHALFAESGESTDQRYHRVGLIVIDEQHRFGVVQRATLRRCGIASHTDGSEPHFLVMSATPIPRTLTMTLYGDLDISLLDQMPPGRQPVRTIVLGDDHISQAYEHIRREVRHGRQAFIVYPLVEESDKLQLRDATSEFERLQRDHFSSERLVLLHGQMPWSTKEDIMQRFACGEFDILVATTVIEVGVDISNATVMLIHHAERFGLAQLHQLRGRVGRGNIPATCFLITSPRIALQVHHTPSSEDPPSVVRLRTMEQTTDGFLIAEVDMKLRGPGDMLGTRQAGMPEFRYIDLLTDGELITQAKHEAFALLNSDPHLRKPEHIVLRSHVADHLHEQLTITTA